MSRVCLLLAAFVCLGSVFIGSQTLRAEDTILRMPADSWESKSTWQGYEYQCKKASCGGDKAQIAVRWDRFMHRSESQIREPWFSVRALAFAMERHVETLGWDADFETITKVETEDYAGFTATGTTTFDGETKKLVLTCLFQEGSRVIIVGSAAPSLDVARRNFAFAMKNGNFRR